MGTNDSSNEPLGKRLTHVPLGHMRRSSLPVAPMPEVIQRQAVHGHSVSVAPETIAEAPEGIDSPQLLSRPLSRAFPTLSSPHLSDSSFMSGGDTSAAATPGPSTPQNLRVSSLSRKSKRLTRKGGKKKKKLSSARKNNKDEDAAPPSYEMAMQQASTPLPGTPLPGETPSTSSAALNQVNESTQTSEPSSQVQEPSPTERVKAAREMFQQISRGNKSVTEESKQTSAAKKTAKKTPPPTFKAKLTRTSSSGGTISRGTVKARKAMLLKAQKPFSECNCSGACSCAHFKLNESSSSSENLSSGGVKSMVHYYLAMEENTKKRERDTSNGKSAAEPKNPETQRPSGSSGRDANNKKMRKLVRNQSAPSMDIVTNPEHETPIGVDPSTEDMERPLITPDTEYPRPVVVPCQSPTSGEDSSDEKAITSIRNRVHQYNQLSQSPSSSPADLQRAISPAPCHGVVTPDTEPRRLNLTQASDVGSSGPSRVKNVKASTSDENIKPGLVREAKSKFITALNHEIRPKLRLQDSDDWNDGGDSPLPVNIPYHNLRNEEVSSPDIVEVDQLPIHPLRQDEAESIEQWDSVSHGKPEPQREEQNDVIPEGLPPSASGTVPKKPAVMSKVNNTGIQPKENHRGKSVVVKVANRGQTNGAQEKRRQTDRPAVNRDHRELEEPQQQGSRGRTALDRPKTLALENNLVVMNLGKQASQSSVEDSEEDHIPKSQTRGHCKVLDETLNETLDSDSDVSYEDESYRGGTTHPQPKSPPTTAESHTKRHDRSEPRAKVKIPIPCPRGSKAKVEEAAEKTSSPTEPRLAPSSPSPELNESFSSSVVSSSSPSSSSPPTPRQVSTPSQPPTLSPQMVRSGIVTIQTGRRLNWDYI